MALNVSGFQLGRKRKRKSLKEISNDTNGEAVKAQDGDRDDGERAEAGKYELLSCGEDFAL